MTMLFALQKISTKLIVMGLLLISATGSALSAKATEVVYRFITKICLKKEIQRESDRKKYKKWLSSIIKRYHKKHW